jgi:hypothetical protein
MPSSGDLETTSLDLSKQCNASGASAAATEPRARQLVKVVVERLLEGVSDVSALRAVRNLARVPALRADLADAGAVEAVVRHFVAHSTPQSARGAVRMTPLPLSAAARATTGAGLPSGTHSTSTQRAHSRPMRGAGKAEDDTTHAGGGDSGGGGSSLTSSRDVSAQSDLAVDAVGLDVGSAVGLAVYSVVESVVLAVGSALGSAVGGGGGGGGGGGVNGDDAASSAADSIADLESGRRTRQGESPLAHACTLSLQPPLTRPRSCCMVHRSNACEWIGSCPHTPAYLTNGTVFSWKLLARSRSHARAVGALRMIVFLPQLLIKPVTPSHLSHLCSLHLHRRHVSRCNTV